MLMLYMVRELSSVHYGGALWPKKSGKKNSQNS